MNRLQILWYVYEAVRRVPCSYRRQALLARKAYGFVTAFLRENPEADRAGLLAAFGEPADFAAAGNHGRGAPSFLRWGRRRLSAEGFASCPPRGGSGKARGLRVPPAVSVQKNAAPHDLFFPIVRGSLFWGSQTGRNAHSSRGARAP